MNTPLMLMHPRQLIEFSKLKLMCTVNSLGRTIKNAVLSLGTILSIFCALHSNALIAENSFPAHRNSCSGQFISSITAPPDRLVQIKSGNRCDTNIVLAPATMNLMPGCFVYTLTTQTGFQTLNSNGGSSIFHSGKYNIIYCMQDNCGTIVCDTSILVVLDAELPNMSCLPEAVVSLNSSGEGSIPASHFDGGSYDNCGHVFFKAKRMNPTVGYNCQPSNPFNQFDDAVNFCCKDIAESPIRIIVRVYDIYPGDGIVADSFYSNHYVECMVMVTVKDKLDPSLIIPPNITISCGEDLDSLYQKQIPTYSDNCANLTLTIRNIENLNACGSGTIDRIYTLSDSLGNDFSKTQVITVLKKSTFNGLDPNQLQWPDHKIVYACRIKSDTINAGEPKITESECDHVVVSKKDELYTFDRGGVCGKILRTWKVINYCVFNPYLTPTPFIPANGYYSFVQEIKIMDTIPPVITNARDTILFSFAPDCGFSSFKLSDVGATDCNASLNIKINFAVDYFSDGKIDRSGNGNNAGGVFPMGKHQVHYYAEDSCHNFSETIVQVQVKDGKAPSVSVLYGLGTNLQDMNGRIMAQINAKKFDNKSSDNCTSVENLRYSFSLDPNDSIAIFTCDDRPLREVSIYVWDECNNYSIAKTFITVQDLDNLCPSNIQHVNLKGNVSSTKGLPLEDVEILMRDSIHFESIKTDILGTYSFEDIPQGMNVILSASQKENALNGISTSDIIKIQQHILGRNPISNSFELLAADVDMNGRISSADIALIRKLLLGVIQEFPSRTSFLFMDKGIVFKDPSNPWDDYNRYNLIHSLLENSKQDADFIGVKLGDVNSSLGSRNSSAVSFTYRQINDEITVYSNVNADIYGYELSLNLKGCQALTEDVKLMQLVSNNFDFDFSTQYNQIKILATSLVVTKIKIGQPLFKIISKDLDGNHISLEIPKSEVRHNILVNQFLEDQNVEMKEFNASNLDQAFSILYYGPNPVSEYFELEILNPSMENLDVAIIDQNGRMEWKKLISFSSEKEILHLRREEFLHQGFYIIQIKSGLKIWTNKIVIN